MHQVIVDGLENYFTGTATREFQAHLTSCVECRAEVLQMREISRLFDDFKPVEEIAPGPDFAARVMAQAGIQREASWWSVFSLEPAFTRRIAFASLVLLAVMGTYLSSQDVPHSVAGAPESVMMVDEPARETDRDRMLVTLTSYQP
jgi:anti-sigma factor RsiW